MNCYDVANRPDPSDVFDMDREWPVANYDWTATVPPVPGTFDPREDAPDLAPWPEDRPPF
tara:strand:+ start:16559 stop:16738 length:180 start_codon:yes stop_codon:yes gene_type:complete